MQMTYTNFDALGPGDLHDPNAIDAVRFTASVPFAGAKPTLRRRRSDARFP
jgi:hypothetical protein